MNVVYWSVWSAFILFFPVLVLFLARDATRVIWGVEDVVASEVDGGVTGANGLPVPRQLTSGREATNRYRIERAPDGRLIKILEDIRDEETAGN